MAFVEQTTLYDYNPTIWRLTSTEDLDYTATDSYRPPVDIVGSVTQIRPGAIPKAESGFVEHNYFDDLYYRIHFYPDIIRVGSLLADKVVKFKVWNAFFVPRTLNSIDAQNTDGISTNAVPDTYEMLEEKIYDITFDIDGPPVINGTYTFNFDVYSLTLDMTGQRVIVFRWRPHKDYKEDLKWQTDLIRTFSGEQRIALRTAPRQVFYYNYIKDSKPYAELQYLTKKWAFRQWGVPVWGQQSDIRNVSAGATSINFDTANAEYEVHAFIWENDDKNEAVSITNVRPDGIDIDPPTSFNWSNAKIMPLKSSIMPDGVNFQRGRGNNISQFSASFLVVNTVDYATSNLVQYDGYDVLTDGNVIIGELNEKIKMPQQQIDNGQGLITVEPTQSYSRFGRTIGKIAKDKAEVWDFRTWLYSRYGKQKPFWLPSFNRDIQPNETIYTTTSVINIKDIGLATYADFPIVTRLELKDGTVFYRKITTSAVQADGENITIDSTLSVDVAQGDIKYWSFMNLVRFDADSITLEYEGDFMQANIPVTEVTA